MLHIIIVPTHRISMSIDFAQDINTVDVNRLFDN